MSVTASMPVHLHMSVGDSEVMNRIGTVDLMVELTPITDENRQPGDAIEAQGRVENFDLAGALRQFADELDRGTVT